MSGMYFYEVKRNNDYIGSRWVWLVYEHGVRIYKFGFTNFKCTAILKAKLATPPSKQKEN